MTRRFPRPWLTALLLTLSFGVLALSANFATAQEQPENARKILNKVVPSYPELARTMQIRGTVRVAVVVAPNGKAKLTQVVGGNPLFVKATIDAIEKWKWAPATQETKELIQLDFHP